MKYMAIAFCSILFIARSAILIYNKGWNDSIESIVGSIELDMNKIDGCTCPICTGEWKEAEDA